MDRQEKTAKTERTFDKTNGTWLVSTSTDEWLDKKNFTDKTERRPSTSTDEWIDKKKLTAKTERDWSRPAQTNG